MRTGDTTTPLVTFIIPSKGRDTLNRTLASLFNQTEQSWRAIIVADGVDIAVAADPRVTVAKVPQTGAANHAAQLRNFGMMRAGTEWVAFVDDDDTLAPTYIQQLQGELDLTPSVETVIFRMLQPGCGDGGSSCVLPPPDHTDFQVTKVGISFAIKRQLYSQGFMFIPGGFEDFHMLEKLRAHKRNMVISKHTTYFVRASPSPDLWLNATVRGTIN
jgi:glycosyltransferase involved in cell wall biosynthesis